MTEKRRYREQSGKQVLKPHGSLSCNEINELFLSAGWLGRRRERPVLLRLVPFLDKGPGPCA